MGVAVRGRLGCGNTISWVPCPGQGPSAVLLRRGPAMVCTADAGVSGPRGVQSFHLFNGQPHWGSSLQRDLPNGLLQAASWSGAVACHGLWTLTSPPQPSGIVENARLAAIIVHLQRAPLPYGEVQLSCWTVPVESR